MDSPVYNSIEYIKFVLINIVLVDIAININLCKQMASAKEDNKHQGVGIVGAGLVGCLTALAFAAKGFSVTLFELRPDPKKVTNEKNLRSINLAVSDRGIRALKYVDSEMADRVLEHVIPMTGRMIHDLSGTKQESQAYGLFGESINSIDRSFLNDYLLDEIRHSDINVHFNHKLIRLDDLSSEEKSPKLTFLDTSESNESTMKSYEFDYVIGADGAHSQFRYQLQKSMRMNISQEYIDMQYLELSIPPNTTGDSKFHIDPNHLHIWPRHEFMLIALANEDGSFTSTFFSPWSVIESFGTSSDKFIDFFKYNFPDAFKLMGEKKLRYAFENQPRGSLMQVNAYPYHNPNGRALIIGDAAHLMVPFYGQGMNCGFEDIRVLMELIDKNNGEVSESFRQYSVLRAEDLQTISKLALDNYHEMSSKVTNVWYLFRKKIDNMLGRYGNGLFQWIPMYTMISFRGDIPYSKAIKIEKRQTKILNAIEVGTLTGFILFGAAKLAQHYHKLSNK